MFSLLLDTHGSDMNIVLYRDKLVCDIYSKPCNNQSKMLIPSIVQLLNNNSIDIKDLSEIVVVNGPGSFTGIRIGVTVAKTISYSLNIPIKSISSLALKTLGINIESNYSVSIPDNKGFFVGEFDRDNNITKDYFYMSNEDYKEYCGNNNVIDSDPNWNNLYDSSSLKEDNCYSIKPLYIKKIEVEK